MDTSPLPAQPQPSADPPLLRARNIGKTFRMGKASLPVLRGCSLDVRSGEFVAILGESGSGKSTLLHILGGLDRPDRDPNTSIDVAGRSLLTMSASQLDQYRRCTVGFVFQAYHLLPELTALQNVMIAGMVRAGPRLRAPSELRPRAMSLLERVGLAERAGHMPSELSGGERQRVAIARALVNQPTLLLADEPTGNLDAVNAQRVLDMLESLRGSLGLTLVLVTHSGTSASRANRLVHLVAGRDAPTGVGAGGTLAAGTDGHAPLPAAMAGSAPQAAAEAPARGLHSGI